ncbi:CHAP domain-containing protein [Roseomonas sp. OT10]|uniref:CHAP domain-containing protein n=1 Tax=Roseomonas cutis TaxID=2897332 RepID=UPI001E52383F|nr:CHAP domain-containing protein [Roseomonas sp. OT10]UFN48068.1 CHAP domain-containing protein [Roseomonas sp. OT10]
MVGRMQGAWRAASGLVLVLGLAACAGPRLDPVAMGYEAGRGTLSCVPYARARSGIDLRGDGWQWWDAAAGRYARGNTPRVDSVLVFRSAGRLRDGHVAVVSRVVSPREIRVDHANWASGGLKGLVARDQLVLDVSPRNDWTQVRVWYPPAGVVGNTVFPTYGFVHHDLLTAGLPGRQG